MNYPNCQKNMEEGYLNARYSIIWSEKEYKLLPLPTKNDVCLFSGVDKPICYLCRDCGIYLSTFKE